MSNLQYIYENKVKISMCLIFSEQNVNKLQIRFKILITTSIQCTFVTS